MKMILKESAVGKVGRTGNSEAEVFVNNNPAIIKEFKKIVSKIGGKAVAAQILNLNLFGNPQKQKELKFTITKQPGEK